MLYERRIMQANNATLAKISNNFDFSQIEKPLSTLDEFPLLVKSESLGVGSLKKLGRSIITNGKTQSSSHVGLKGRVSKKNNKKPGYSGDHNEFPMVAHCRSKDIVSIPPMRSDPESNIVHQKNVTNCAYANKSDSLMCTKIEDEGFMDCLDEPLPSEPLFANHSKPIASTRATPNVGRSQTSVDTLGVGKLSISSAQTPDVVSHPSDKCGHLNLHELWDMSNTIATTHRVPCCDDQVHVRKKRSLSDPVNCNTITAGMHPTSEHHAAVARPASAIDGVDEDELECTVLLHLISTSLDRFNASVHLDEMSTSVPNSFTNDRFVYGEHATDVSSSGYGSFEQRSIRKDLFEELELELRDTSWMHTQASSACHIQVASDYPDCASSEDCLTPCSTATLTEHNVTIEPSSELSVTCDERLPDSLRSKHGLGVTSGDRNCHPAVTEFALPYELSTTDSIDPPSSKPLVSMINSSAYPTMTEKFGTCGEEEVFVSRSESKHCDLDGLFKPRDVYDLDVLLSDINVMNPVNCASTPMSRQPDCSFNYPIPRDANEVRNWMNSMNYTCARSLPNWSTADGSPLDERIVTNRFTPSSFSNWKMMNPIVQQNGDNLNHNSSMFPKSAHSISSKYHQSVCYDAEPLNSDMSSVISSTNSTTLNPTNVTGALPFSTPKLSKSTLPFVTPSQGGVAIGRSCQPNSNAVHQFGMHHYQDMPCNNALHKRSRQISQSSLTTQFDRFADAHSLRSLHSSSVIGSNTTSKPLRNTSSHSNVARRAGPTSTTSSSSLASNSTQSGPNGARAYGISTESSYKSDCSNGKPLVAKSNRACSFYLRGHCKKDDCEFAHDLTKVTCKFWAANECFKGSTCPFLHGYPSEAVK